MLNLQLPALALAFGILCGYWVTDNHYTAKLAKHDRMMYEQHMQELKRQAEQTKHYKQISETYYEQFQNASNAEPTVVTERVFVRAACTDNDTRENTSGGMGNETAGQRAELHAETVRRITAVTDRAERDVKQCRTALHSLQDKITINNQTK